MSQARSSNNTSGGADVRGLIRKYSSDSDVSPQAQKPPDKKKPASTIMPDPDAPSDPIAGQSAVPNASTLQVTPAPATPTDFASLGNVLNQIYSKIDLVSKDVRDCRQEVNDCRQSLSTRISNLEQSLSDKITRECEQIRTDIMLEVAAVDAKVTTLTTSFNQLETDLKASNDRITTVEEALAAADALNPEFYHETTIIATNLPFADPEDIKEKAQSLINALTSACDPALPQINVVNAMRTPARNNKPGVVKIQFASRQNKIDILRNKRKLTNHATYSRVFIRGSQSHTDRLIQLNTNTLLNELGLNDRYRVAANGRLVPKSDDGTASNGFYQQQRFDNGPPAGHLAGPPTGPPTGPPGQFNMQQHTWPRPNGTWPNAQRQPGPRYQNGRY